MIAGLDLTKKEPKDLTGSRRTLTSFGVDHVGLVEPMDDEAKPFLITWI
jgi:hypothetical protein